MEQLSLPATATEPIRQSLGTAPAGVLVPIACAPQKRGPCAAGKTSSCSLWLGTGPAAMKTHHRQQERKKENYKINKILAKRSETYIAKTSTVTKPK